MLIPRGLFFCSPREKKVREGEKWDSLSLSPPAGEIMRQRQEREGGEINNLVEDRKEVLR